MNYAAKITKHTEAIIALRKTSDVERESARTVALMTAAMSDKAYQRYLTEVQATAAVDGKGFKAIHRHLSAGASQILAEDNAQEKNGELADEVVVELNPTKPMAA